MKKYIKTYLDYFVYSEDEFIPSELSGVKADHIHHILFKSQGGKDNIENLIALTSDEHARAHLLQKPYIIKEKLWKITRNRQ